MKNFKQIIARTIGLFLMTFLPGMGIGAVISKDWLNGGEIAFGSGLATVVVYLGVALTWSGKWTAHDVQEAFRTAAAKSGSTNDEVAKVLTDVQATPTPPVAG
jgi:hypothetical protein